MGAQAAVSRVGIAMVASAALVLGFVTPSYAEEAAPADPVTPFELPPLEESPEVEVPGTEFPVGDFDQLVAVPSDGAWGKKLYPGGVAPKPLDVDDLDFSELEVVEQDEFSTTYQLDDGSFVSTVSPTPQNVAVGDEWVPVTTEWASFGPFGGGLFAISYLIETWKSKMDWWENDLMNEGANGSCTDPEACYNIYEVGADLGWGGYGSTG